MEVELRPLIYALDIVAFARNLLGWTPDEKQALVLRSTARQIVLNCARQWGKTTVAATKVVHLAINRPGSVALIVCENMSQTGEFFLKIDRFLSRLGILSLSEPGKEIARRLPNG